ncbi:MAG: DUF3253 domain-containing protein [Pseudomonadota bacterium]
MCPSNHRGDHGGARPVRRAEVKRRGSPKPRTPGVPEIEAAILALVTKRGAGKTICPSEAARRLDPEHWRRLMTPVRNAAAALARRGVIEIRRKGKVIDPDQLRGVIRLALPDGGET